MLLLLLLLNTLLLAAASNRPDSMGCCAAAGVSPECRRHFCDLNATPQAEFDNNLLAFTRHYNTCRQFMSSISQCLADGRNNSACCRQHNAAVSRSCFDMCDATASTASNVWDHQRNYQECIVFNIDYIYGCFFEGYERSPNTPRDVSIQVLGPSKVLVTWHVPEKNAHLVDHYSVRVSTNVPIDEPVVMATTRKQLELPNLRPDTKYSLTVVAVAADGEHKSLPTEALSFVTNGVPPQMTPYQQRVEAALHTHVTLVCKIEVLGWQHKHLQVRWEKLNAGSGSYDVLHNDEGAANTKYSHRNLTYVSAYHKQPRVYISALKINHISLADFGSYQCTSANAFGKGQAQISLSPVIDPFVPPAPPNMTECCERAGVSPGCLGSCTDTNSTLPSRTSCILDATKILGCSMTGKDMGACCLRQRVPLHCLSFCDGTLHKHKSSNPFLKSAKHGQHPYCIFHTHSIYQCIEEQTVDLPETPRQLHVLSQSAESALVSWRPSARALRYHVYYRGTGGWTLQSVLGTEAELTQLQPDRVHDVIIVAANDSGRSGPSATLQLFTGRIQRDLAMPYDADDAARFRASRLSAGRLMEEHFDSADSALAP